MAKIKLSAIVSEMRGKLNGSVFSKNKGGAYIRTKVTPSNPSTIAQGAVRAALTSFAQGWRGLTEAQRDAWNAAVSSWATTDIFGDIKNPSGINLYNKLNLNLFNIGQSAIDVPPLPASVGFLDSLTLTAAEGTPTLSAAFTAVGLAAGQTMVIEATPLVSAGINNAKSKFRKISTVAGGTASPINILAAYTAKFGALVAGQKIMVRIKCVDNATGTSGQYTQASAIVAA